MARYTILHFKESFHNYPNGITLFTLLQPNNKVGWNILPEFFWFWQWLETPRYPNWSAIWPLTTNTISYILVDLYPFLIPVLLLGRKIHICVSTGYPVSALSWHSHIHWSLYFYPFGKYNYHQCSTQAAFLLNVATDGSDILPFVQIALTHLSGNWLLTYLSGLQSVITWQPISGRLSANRCICSGQCCRFGTTCSIPFNLSSTHLGWFPVFLDELFAFPFDFPDGYTTSQPQQNQTVTHQAILPIRS